ncbi:acylneuraminate cytidylyltransferase family protein [Prochlorococcus sp. AH-716-K03]|nr:acylneuraminate cytidylyltransferase family protein [Prochlorococcus sp. AH-716-K03]
MIDCIIPARSGSKGIPKKNITLLEDLPLIAYSIFVAISAKRIKNVYVSTDSEEIAEIANLYGAKTPFLRPSYLASDKASDKQVFLHFYQEAYKLNIPITEDIVHLRPTTPGRSIEIVDQAILDFLLSNKCTSMRSAHKSFFHPHKWFNLNEGYFNPLIRGVSNIEVTNMPRQSFPDVYIPNGYVDIVKYSTFKFSGAFHGNKIKSFITEKVIDIDKHDDLKKAMKEPIIKKLSKSIKKKYLF